MPPGSLSSVPTAAVLRARGPSPDAGATLVDSPMAEQAQQEHFAGTPILRPLQLPKEEEQQLAVLRQHLASEAAHAAAAARAEARSAAKAATRARQRGRCASGMAGQWST